MVACRWQTFLWHPPYLTLVKLQGGHNEKGMLNRPRNNRDSSNNSKMCNQQLSEFSSAVPGSAVLSLPEPLGPCAINMPCRTAGERTRHDRWQPSRQSLKGTRSQLPEQERQQVQPRCLPKGMRFALQKTRTFVKFPAVTSRTLGPCVSSMPFRHVICTAPLQKHRTEFPVQPITPYDHVGQPAGVTRP